MAEEIVRIVGVSRQFRMGSETVSALHKLDLTIERGEFIAIVGASGSGKSTLLHIVGGLDTPTEGTVIVDDEDISTMSDRARAAYRNRKIGFVFQDFYLQPHLTALENVELPLKLRNTIRAARLRKAEAMLQLVGLQMRARHRPNQLSGGERQRVAIARALVGEPAIILADEPTGNLDSGTGGELISLLQQLNTERGITIVVATHDRRVAAAAHREVILQDGKIGS